MCLLALFLGCLFQLSVLCSTFALSVVKFLQENADFTCSDGLLKPGQSVGILGRSRWQHRNLRAGEEGWWWGKAVLLFRSAVLMGGF